MCPTASGHVPTAARPPYPVSRDPTISGTGRSPAAGHPDIPAGTPTPVASDPEIAGIGRRSVVLHTRRGWRHGDDASAVVAGRRHHTAAERQGESEGDGDLTRTRSDSGHVNLTTN